MSTHLVDAIVAVKLGEKWPGEPSYMTLELGGDTNCTVAATGARARDWCARGIGAKWEIVGQAARESASCSGGMLRLTGKSRTEPETFIGAYRRALAAALTFEEAAALGLRITLRLRLPTAPKDDEIGRFEYDRKALREAGRVAVAEDYYGTPTEVYAFDWRIPADLELWLKHTRNPAWFSAEVDGPERGYGLDMIRRAMASKRELPVLAVAE